MSYDVSDGLSAEGNLRCFALFCLLDLEQRPVREIAALTGWGESKIKVTAMRARRKLATRLAELERTPPA